MSEKIKYTIEQHATLPDDEKGKYREVWEQKHYASADWYEPVLALCCETYEEFCAEVNEGFEPRQIFRLIEQPVEESKPVEPRKTCGEEDYGDCDCDNCIYNITD